MADPQWMRYAECHGLTDLFFPERGDTFTIRQAKAVCARCPVRAACLEHALTNGEKWGIWGGLTAKERRLLRRERRAS